VDNARNVEVGKNRYFPDGMMERIALWVGFSNLVVTDNELLMSNFPAKDAHL